MITNRIKLLAGKSARFRPSNSSWFGHFTVSPIITPSYSGGSKTSDLLHLTNSYLQGVTFRHSATSARRIFVTYHEFLEPFGDTLFCHPNGGFAHTKLLCNL